MHDVAQLALLMNRLVTCSARGAMMQLVQAWGVQQLLSDSMPLPCDAVPVFCHGSESNTKNMLQAWDHTYPLGLAVLSTITSVLRQCCTVMNISGMPVSTTGPIYHMLNKGPYAEQKG